MSNEPLVGALLQSQPGGERPLTPREMIERLQLEGYMVTKYDPISAVPHIARVGESHERWEGGSILRFGSISCTHLGSRKQQLTFLNAFYDRCAYDGVPTVLHSGDVSEGDGHVYKGHEYDIFLHGADAQRDYLVGNYPRRNGVTTYMIAGNHDWSFYQRGGFDLLKSVAAANGVTTYMIAGNHDWSFYHRGGFDLLKSVAAERPDITYLGPMAGEVEFEDGITVYIAHGDGGNAYARSYKPQKRVEQFAPEQKPEVFLLGHYHTFAHIPMYRNVVTWQLGCFQAQTDYLKRKGLYPEIGGLIMKIYYGTHAADRPNGFVRVIEELVPFYVPLDNDI